MLFSRDLDQVHGEILTTDADSDLERIGTVRWAWISVMPRPGAVVARLVKYGARWDPRRRGCQPALEDGKKVKRLARYLRAAHNMSVADYRLRWAFPDDCSLAAPNYSARRSALTKQLRVLYFELSSR